MSNENVTKVSFPDSNRIGKFSILSGVLAGPENRVWLKALMGLCIILEAYPDESGRGTTYIAASELFDELKEGDEVPTYRIDMVGHGARFDNDVLEARRVDSGNIGFAAVRNTIIRVPLAQIATNMGVPGKPH